MTKHTSSFNRHKANHPMHSIEEHIVYAGLVLETSKKYFDAVLMAEIPGLIVHACSNGMHVVCSNSMHIVCSNGMHIVCILMQTELFVAFKPYQRSKTVESKGRQETCWREWVGVHV